MIRLRRWFGTLHAGHVWKGKPDGEDHLPEHFRMIADDIAKIQSEPATSIAGSTPLSHLSMALEIGEKDERIHIQFYAEFKAPVYPKTLQEIFQSEMPPHTVGEVKNARGAYEYCTGTGRYHGKPAIERFAFGEARAASTIQDTRLKVAVDMIVAGSHPHDIAKFDAYAYACHSRKLWDLYLALRGKDIRDS